MKIIGITGGIGCGKSYVARKMERRGIPVYDTDSQAKRLMVKDQSIIDGVSALIPGAYVNGELDRPKVAAFLFAHSDNARKIDSIVHPAVRCDFRRWAMEQNCDLCAIESAILFESGFNTETDAVIVVDAPVEVRIRRCMERDGAVREKIVQRMKQQMDQAQKCSMADFVVVNDDVADIESQLDRVIDNLK